MLNVVSEEKIKFCCQRLVRTTNTPGIRGKCGLVLNYETSFKFIFKRAKLNIYLGLIVKNFKIQPVSSK